MSQNDWPSWGIAFPSALLCTYLRQKFIVFQIEIAYGSCQERQHNNHPKLGRGFGVEESKL